MSKGQTLKWVTQTYTHNYSIILIGKTREYDSMKKV